MKMEGHEKENGESKQRELLAMKPSNDTLNELELAANGVTSPAAGLSVLEPINCVIVDYGIEWFAWCYPHLFETTCSRDPVATRKVALSSHSSDIIDSMNVVQMEAT
ncbi:hypothetical protein JG687_00017039 [Phytophthora cactorum]|uniref:Uncharacterized protein n=2 Tax=Phytophthora cactorum TaxID=29920 RepID=A0A329RY09_9STRA|nr:hypothetical protein PC112_g20303 [Phytophthora cactorum]KAG2801348.1 hypothetical protein PC111_g19578 [Phytophthora cactorum]KAG2835779.1 hypothetical protein PC113_g20156 [Phytophthora cactorum]KAG2884659.1 hypothetical protein PC115_g21278 [Phytophthora cactorum]KAG2979286.1 hypothetical protein PC119_g21516 [Phytophthora cactorum]